MKQILLFTLLLNTIFVFGTSIDVYSAARKGDTITLLTLIEINKDTINTVNEYGHTPLILAAYNNQIETVKFLTSHGVKINYKSSQGTALHGAAYKGYFDIIKLLVESGAETNIQDDNGAVALSYSTIAKNTIVSTYLFNAGANVFLKDATGDSPLDYAIALNLTELIVLYKSRINE